ncbi:hypothetical protein F511_09054 [Dorcoceras hygrometricum]|uniref:Uncharacterized protein n=1 Tax=Dorcoceras hygrometricum TaxID=472368 RepID=A0A2Z7ATJ5_9LAMI|nr:hypothetical protein F511_09054 [Dorcoceras hygrometricum]
METVVVVAPHKNHHQSYSRNRANGSSKGGSFRSAPGGHFRGVNCRTFQPGSGLFTTPLKSYSTVTPAIKRAFSSFSPKTPSPPVRVNQKGSKGNGRSCSYPIPIDIKIEDNKRLMNDDFDFYERWAGATYSNSPPPSSLPIPTFSVQPKQSHFLDLDASTSEIGLRFAVKSVLTSPTRDHGSVGGDVFYSADTATKTLRRILNLDITDN